MEVQVEQKGPNGWAAAIIGGFIALAGVLLAAAVWSIANWLGIAILCVGAGEGLRRVCLGAAIVIRQHQAGRAELIRAEGDARARMIEARARRIEVMRVRQLPGGDR